MDKEELKRLLRDNLYLIIHDNYYEGYARIELVFDGETIVSETINVRGHNEN